MEIVPQYLKYKSIDQNNNEIINHKQIEKQETIKSLNKNIGNSSTSSMIGFVCFSVLIIFTIITRQAILSSKEESSITPEKGAAIVTVLFRSLL